MDEKFVVLVRWAIVPDCVLKLPGSKNRSRWSNSGPAYGLSWNPPAPSPRSSSRRPSRVTEAPEASVQHVVTFVAVSPGIGEIGAVHDPFGSEKNSWLLVREIFLPK